MIEIKFVRQNLPEIEKALSRRGQTADLETFKQCDAERKALLVEIENLRHRRNVVSEQIAAMKKDGQDADDLVIQMREVANKIKALDHDLSENEDKIKQILLELPNMPHNSVPAGKDSSENPVVKQIGTPPDFDFEPLPHWRLGEKLKILDFETAAKITGARFPLYLGKGARLERALINFMLDIHTTV
jgi:seryl-tRNA synthetase